ncbi:MAG: glycosyltransferase family 2 protein [Terricaulis sp.]
MSLLIVIPCLNEEAHLPGLLATLAAETAEHKARIVVVDGGSTDRSAEIVRAFAETEPRVALLHNPKRIQSAAVNMAVKLHAAESDVFIRVDAHAHYPEGFIASLIAAHAETKADSVTVAMRACAQNGACFQSAAAAAQNSVLGNGGSSHRKGGERKWVDHGHHALFSTRAFLAVDGYDESFTHNEDAELDTRIRANGGKILLAADILIDYFPRRTARALMRQYFMFGRGRAKTMLKHRAPLKPRQLVPIVIAPMAAAALLAPFAPWIAAPFAAYLTLCLAYGATLGQSCARLAGAPAILTHIAWSAGFWTQLALSAGPAHKRAHNPLTSEQESV